MHIRTWRGAVTVVTQKKLPGMMVGLGTGLLADCKVVLRGYAVVGFVDAPDAIPQTPTFVWHKADDLVVEPRPRVATRGLQFIHDALTNAIAVCHRPSFRIVSLHRIRVMKPAAEKLY